MTDKLDLSEEIAALRRTVAAQSVMIKQAIHEIEGLHEATRRPHERLDRLEVSMQDKHLRLQILENWQYAISQPTVPSPPQPLGGRMYANDNEPCSAPPRHPPDEYSQQINALQNQKALLISDLGELIKYYKRRGIVSGDIWELITALDAVLCRYRVDERA